MSDESNDYLIDVVNIHCYQVLMYNLKYSVKRNVLFLRCEDGNIEEDKNIIQKLQRKTYIRLFMFDNLQFEDYLRK